VDVSEHESLLIDRVTQYFVILRLFHQLNVPFFYRNLIAVFILFFQRVNSCPTQLEVFITERFAVKSLAEISFFTDHTFSSPSRDALVISTKLFINFKFFLYVHQPNSTHAFIEQPTDV
jgi:hypothetical protein